MTKDQYSSKVRELLTAVGAAVAQFGFMSENTYLAWSGLALAAAMLAWSLKTHSGKQIVFTSVRKLLSAGAGVAVAYGIMTPEKVEAVLGVVLVLLSVYSGDQVAKSVKDGSANLLLLVLTAGILMGLPSCATIRGIEVTDDGCILSKQEGAAGTYYAGPCFVTSDDGSQEIDRFQVIWNHPEGDLLRATYWVGDTPKPVVIEYQIGETWISYDSKAGFLLGFVPPEVKQALDGDPQPLERPTMLFVPDAPAPQIEGTK